MTKPARRPQDARARVIPGRKRLIWALKGFVKARVLAGGPSAVRPSHPFRCAAPLCPPRDDTASIDTEATYETAVTTGSSGSASLLERLQRAQTECDAWQSHAERLARRLTLERWQRSGGGSNFESRFG